MSTSAPALASAVVSIRPAESTDRSAIEGLLASSGLPTEGVAQSLCGFLVATADGRLIGVVGMEQCGEYGLLRSTAVMPEWRGHRVAKQLVERIVADAESQGVRALYLLTTTAETYFPSFGFRVTSRDDAPTEIRATSEFRGACPASATLMCLAFVDEAARSGSAPTRSIEPALPTRQP